MTPQARSSGQSHECQLSLLNTDLWRLRMGVTRTPSTLPGGLTPVCNTCGIHLCWAIGEHEYEEQKGFWDTWRCESCNLYAKGARKRWLQAQSAELDRSLGNS